MLTHYFTLRALARELRPAITGAAIEEVFTQQKNELIISLSPSPRTHEEGVVIAASVTPGFNYVVLPHRLSRAKRNSVDLFPTIIGSTIDEIDVPPGERIITLHLGGNRRLLFRMFDTAESNILLTGERGEILRAFKNDKRLRGTTVIEPGRPGVFDDAGDAGDLGRLLRTGSGSLIAGLKRLFPHFGGIMLREALRRAGLPENLPAPPDDAGISRLQSAIREIAEEAEHPTPFLYTTEGEMPVVSVVRLTHRPADSGTSFATVNEALQRAIAVALKQRGAADEKEELSKKIGRELRRLERTADKVAARAREGGAADRSRATGRLILSHLGELKKGMREARLLDSESGERHRVVLDPALTPAQNAERYFEKGRKEESGREQTLDRSEAAQKKIAELRRLESALEECETSSDLRKFRQEFEKELGRPEASGRSADGKALPFRIFTVEGGLEVWVGKNSAANDLLTMHYARPNDLWFHIRGAGGSHTILRVQPGRNPARESVVSAASIAAYYSKMRNAGTVPVAYCERKYVRKRRNAPAGEVILDREEVLFVKPHLP